MDPNSPYGQNAYPIDANQYPQHSQYPPSMQHTEYPNNNQEYQNYPQPTIVELKEDSKEHRECQILEQELQQDPVLSKIHSRRCKHKIILFPRKDHVDLFDEISSFADQSQSTRRDALETFLTRDHSDAIINIIYEYKVECVLIYDSEKVEEKKKDDKKSLYRSQFLQELLHNQVFLVIERSKINEQERFVQLVASFETLAHQAEILKFRFQLNVEAIIKHIPEFDNALNQSRAGIVNRPLTFLTNMIVQFSSEKRSVPFEYEKMADFKEGDMDRLGARVKETFFSAENRIQLLHTVVTGTSVKLKHNSSKRSSIRELVDLKVFLDYYFLHGHRLPGEPIDEDEGIREKMKTWSNKISFAGVPLIEIRKYFGENVAFYFAWLDFYTTWFKSLSFVGLVTFGFGLVKYFTTRTPFVIVVLDNEATSYFAFLISIWSLFFLKFWKRRANYLKFVWDMDNFDTQDRIRVEWRATWKRISPVTGKPELYEPLWLREARKFVAGFTMLVAFAGLCALIGANLAFTGYLFNSSVVPGNVSGVVGTALFTVLQIGLVAPVYSSMVVALNNFENYKTQTEYLGNLVWKQFIMCFVNSFGMLYFSSMVKPIADEVDPNVRYFGYYVTKCTKTNEFSSCFSDLAISIGIVFGVQQFITTGFQLIYPSLLSWWSKRSTKKKEGESEPPSLPYYMKQFFLAPVTIDLLSSEYSTKIIQLGYVLLFSAPFPLAPVLACLNNIIEMRVDLWKFLKLYRRPFVETADAIGAWQGIMTGLVYLSTISNSVIIAFTSHTLHNYFSQLTDNPLSWKLGFIIVFEHILLLVAVVIDKLISDVPEAVRIGREAEEYLERLRDEVSDDIKSNASL